jgi:hypothetical protein
MSPSSPDARVVRLSPLENWRWNTALGSRHSIRTCGRPCGRSSKTARTPEPLQPWLRPTPIWPEQQVLIVDDVLLLRVLAGTAEGQVRDEVERGELFATSCWYYRLSRDTPLVREGAAVLGVCYIILQ